MGSPGRDGRPRCPRSSPSPAPSPSRRSRSAWPLSKSLSDAGGALSSGDAGAAAASKLEAGGKAMDKASSDFEALDPPSDAKDANAKIADGFHKLAGQFHSMAQLAKAKDVAGLTKSLTAFENSDGAQEIQKAQEELAAAGYKIKNG
jgi:hypothetical protein